MFTHGLTVLKNTHKLILKYEDLVENKKENILKIINF